MKTNCWLFTTILIFAALLAFQALVDAGSITNYPGDRWFSNYTANGGGTAKALQKQDTVFLHGSGATRISASGKRIVVSSTNTIPPELWNYTTHKNQTTTAHGGIVSQSDFGLYSTGKNWNGSTTQYMRADGSSQTLTAVGSGSGLSTDSRVTFDNISTPRTRSTRAKFNNLSSNQATFSSFAIGTAPQANKILLRNTVAAAGTSKFIMQESNGNYYMQVLDNGNFYLGGDATGTQSGRLFIQSTTTDGIIASRITDASTVGGSIILRSAQGVKSTPTSLANNNALGSFLFSGYAGNAYQTTSAIKSLVEGTVSTGVLPSRLAFYTGAASTLVEAATINSTGNFGLGTGTFGTSATKVISIGSGTKPTTSQADAITIGSFDMEGAGTATMYVRDEQGTFSYIGKVSSFPSQIGLGTTTPRAGYGFDSYSTPAIIGSTNNAVIIDKNLCGIRLKGKAVAFDDLQFVIAPKDPSPGTCHPVLSTFLTPLEEYIFQGAAPVPPTGCGAGEYEHVSMSSVELPHNWALLPGTTNALGDFHVHMTTGATGTSPGHKAKWKLTVSCSGLNSSTFRPVRNMYAQYSSSTTTAAYTSQFISFGQYTATACAGIGSNLKTRIARIPKNAGGTEVVDPYLIQLGLHHAIDGFGSNDPTSYGTKTATP